MANKARLLEVAALLRALPEDFQFDMYRVLRFKRGFFCGCIAGLTMVKLGTVPEMKQHSWEADGELTPDDGSYVQAKKILGLTSEETDALFFPDSDENINIDYDKVTAQIAADVVERFALTGEISWPEEVMGEDDES